MASSITVEYRECVLCATLWRPDTASDTCPVCEAPKATQVPEGLVAFNLTREDLTTLAAICSYYKNTNPYPGKDSQRVAANVIERARGY